MKYVSLFAGIGGLDLALDALGFEPAGQVEIDPFCSRILEARYPAVPRLGDVKALHGRGDFDGMLVGGFPCQPVSVAGRALAQDDPRWLWPEFARLIGEMRPKLVFIENVPGLRTRGLELVLADLEALGYGGAWDIVSAADVGALHLRKRLWILAERGRIGFKGRTTRGVNGAEIPTPTARLGMQRGPQAKRYFDPARSNDLDDYVAAYPTSTVSDATGGAGVSVTGHGGMNLRTAVRFPTVRSTDGDRGGRGDRQAAKTFPTPMSVPGSEASHGQVSGRFRTAMAEANRKYPPTYPTPAARDHKDSGPNVDWQKVAAKSKLAGVVMLDPETTGSGPLNPAWVEWLMGLPIGWTQPDATNDDLIVWPWDSEPPIPRLLKGVEHRRERLTAIGNAVVPQSAIAAFVHLAARLGLSLDKSEAPDVS